MAEVTVTIAGRNYRLACDEGQEQHLAHLGDMLDHKIADMKTSFGEIGDLRLAVMAAIVVADELSQARRQIATLESKMQRLGNPDGRMIAANEQEMTEAVDLVDHLAERLEILGADLRARLRGSAETR
jgi:cell division protein ZapA